MDITTTKTHRQDLEKGSTNFEEETGKRRDEKETAHKEEYSTDEEDAQQATKPEEGIKSLQQPTEQESREHNLTPTKQSIVPNLR